MSMVAFTVASPALRTSRGTLSMFVRCMRRTQCCPNVRYEHSHANGSGISGRSCRHTAAIAASSTSKQTVNLQIQISIGASRRVRILHCARGLHAVSVASTPVLLDKSFVWFPSSSRLSLKWGPGGSQTTLVAATGYAVAIAKLGTQMCEFMTC